MALKRINKVGYGVISGACFSILTVVTKSVWEPPSRCAPSLLVNVSEMCPQKPVRLGEQLGNLFHEYPQNVPCVQVIPRVQSMRFQL